MSDLIERQAAIDELAIGAELLKRVLDDVDVVGYKREKYKLGLDLIESYILDMKELPSVQPRSGKWIITSEFEDCCYAKCNQCNATQIFYYNKPLTNFCPNCGADMRGELDE